MLCANTQSRFTLIIAQINDRKVMTPDIEALAQVKPVGRETLHAGVQVQLVTTKLTGMGFKPCDHFRPGSFGPVALGRYQVVDVNVLPQANLIPTMNPATHRISPSDST